jgi:hypothetical protein
LFPDEAAFENFHGRKVTAHVRKLQEFEHWKTQPRKAVVADGSVAKSMNSAEGNAKGSTEEDDVEDITKSFFQQFNSLMASGTVELQ